MSEDAVRKTAFSTPSGLYEFVSAPFRLTRVPGVFQLFMQFVLTENCQKRTFRGPDLEILGTGSWTLGGRGLEQSNYGWRERPVGSAYGPSTEGEGTRVCGYAIKNSGLTVVR